MTAGPSRSIFVEFAGMPKSGKTTVMDVVSHYLRRAGVAVSEYHGGGRYAPVGKESLSVLNLYLACQIVQHLLDHAADRRLPRLHLLDRGVVDRIIFTRALRRLQRVSSAHETAVTALLTCEDVPQPDLCFVFVTSTELSLAREQRHKLLGTPGTVMNDDLLAALRASALGVVEEARGDTVVLVDTAERDGAVPATALSALARMASTLDYDGFPEPPGAAL